MSIISGRYMLLPTSRMLHKGTATAQNRSLKTAGIIVIGDEILKGDVLDTNSNYLTRALHELGVKVKKVSVIGDVVDEIADEVKCFSGNYNYVLTTGGIGPTHDDVTFEAIAKAFEDPLVPHPTLVEICSHFYKTTDINSPGMKLAFIPKSAKLTFGECKIRQLKVNYPNISVKNVYIFPGIPQLLQKSIDVLGANLFSSDCKFYSKNIYINVTEQFIADALAKLVKEYPNVSCGSYPKMFNDNDYKVKVTIESTDEKTLMEASEKLLKMVPKEYIAK